jgi:hypothetical protein
MEDFLMARKPTDEELKQKVKGFPITQGPYCWINDVQKN